MGKSGRVEKGEGWELIRPCPRCGQLDHSCSCRTMGEAAPVRPRVRLEKRKGRTVTVVTGLGLEPEALKRLARLWKRRLGSGGTVKGNALELQGDVRDEVKGFLAESR